MASRSRRKTFLLAVLAVLLLTLPAHRDHASGYTTVYSVYADYCGQTGCQVSPPQCGNLVGEWTRECDGTLTGWGQEMGEECTRTEIGAIVQCE